MKITIGERDAVVDVNNPGSAHTPEGAAIDLPREFWRYVFAGAMMIVSLPEYSAEGREMCAVHAVARADALLKELEKPALPEGT